MKYLIWEGNIERLRKKVKTIMNKAKKYGCNFHYEEIRAEIIKLQTYKMFVGEDTVYVERHDVLDILDKYKTESEVEE